MLNILRKKGFAKKVIWVIAIVIIISFGFFGTAYLLTGSGHSGYAGKIFGKKISIEDFNKIYQSTRIQAVREYGYNLNQVAHLLNLEAQTWDRLILLHEAKKRNIKISDDDVIRTIKEDKSFERNSQFDVLLYNAILRNLQIRARDYEESVRDNLKIAELFKQVTSSVTIAEEDVFGEYKKRNEKTQVSYVFAPNESFKGDVSVDEDQAKKYYEDNKSEFLMPPAINVQYLTFNFPEEIKIEETAENPETEESPQEDQDPANEEKKDLIREKAAAALEELLIDPDMSKVAQQNNLTIQTSGFFSKEQPDFSLGWSYDFLNKIFEMGEGEISEPFETASGLSIVQIKEKREPYIPDFSEARLKSEEAVINKESKEISKKKTAEYLKAINEELDKSKLRDFPKAAKDLGLEIHQTPIFSRGQYLPQIGISKEFQEAAFTLTEDNKISNVIETTTGYCILHLDNYVPIENSDYEKAREGLAQELSDEKRNTLFGDFVVQLRNEAKIFDNLSQSSSQSQ